MILLVGATGTLGRRIAAKLDERGIPFRALLREAADAGGLGGAEIVRGDLHRPETLPAALADVETVVTTANSVARRLAGDKTVSIADTDLRGNENLVRAAEAAGVGRFVFVSVQMNDAMLRAPLPRAKRRIEELLERSPMREVLVRPDMFQEVWLSELVQFDWRNGKALVFGRGETPHAYVAIDDVAEAAVRVAVADDPPRVLTFGGPEALTRNEAVRRFEQAAGRPIRVRRVPRAALRAGSVALRRLNPLQASLMGMAYAADTTPSPARDEELRELGIEARPVSDYIADVTGGSP